MSTANNVKTLSSRENLHRMNVILMDVKSRREEIEKEMNRLRDLDAAMFFAELGLNKEIARAIKELKAPQVGQNDNRFRDGLDEPFERDESP